MKKTIHCLACMIMLLFITERSYSQNNFVLSAGLSFPISDFAYDDMEDRFVDAGGATVGFNVGGKYTHLFGDKGFGLFVSANAMYNGLKSSAKDNLEVEDALNSLGSDFDVSYYKYINIPLVTGITYRYALNDNLALFGDVGVGANFLKLTNMKIEDNNEEVKVSYDLSTRFAYSIQAGLIINDKYTVGLGYNSLGTHLVTGDVIHSGGMDYSYDTRIHIEIVTLNFGIQL